MDYKFQERKMINIDPTILFIMLIALTQLDENVQDHFAYKFTLEPTA